MNPNLYRLQVISRVKYPSRQISLDLTNCHIRQDISLVGNVNALHLGGSSGVTDVSALKNVILLNLDGCSRVKDVSALGNVHTLSLHYCTI
jgi:hypothetical protein